MATEHRTGAHTAPIDASLVVPSTAEPREEPTRVEAGALVRRAREEAGMSLRELARRIRVSPGTMSAVETGKTQLTFTRLQEIASALDKTAAELLLDIRLPASDGVPEAPTPSNVHELRRFYSELGSRSDRSDWRSYQPIPIGPVLLAGLAVFVETGYHAATVRTVADAAGMSVAGIYHHFPSKQEILARLFLEALSDLAWRTEAAAGQSDDPVDRFACLVECLAQYHAQRWAFALLLATEMRSLEPPASTEITRMLSVEQARLNELIQAGTDASQFSNTHGDMAARAILSMCTGLPHWYRPGGRISPSDIGREYAALALDMVGAGPVGPVRARLRTPQTR